MIPNPCLKDICYHSEECIFCGGSGGLYLTGGPEMIAAVDGTGPIHCLVVRGGYRCHPGIA